MKTAKKLDRQFKIQGIGLDSSNLNYIPDSEYLEKFTYIHTSTSKNNDCMLSEIFTDGIELRDFNNNKILVTEIDCVDSISKVIVSHMNAVGKDWIDILEIPASCNWTEDTAEQLNGLIEAGLIYDISVKNPGSVERLNEIVTILNTFNVVIEYISIDICPLNFNIDLIKWCTENNIGILGYNPMGGYINSANIIQSFTVPYLLGFAATYCNVVFLSSRDMHKSIQSAKYLSELVGEYTESIYTLSKSVSKLQKPLKRVVHTSAIFDTNTYIPYCNPENVPTENESILITLGNNDTELIPENEEKTDLEIDITAFISQISFPHDASKETKFSIAKNQIISCLKSKKPDHIFSYSMINDTTIAIMAKKDVVTGWFKKTTVTEQSTYLVAMRSNGLVYFKECK